MTEQLDLKALTPPACPLGADFARQTARRVLERASDDRRRVEPVRGGYAQRLWTNPLQQIVRRQRTRRFFQLPNVFLLLLFYALPGLFFGQMGDPEQQQAYFGVVQAGLTLIVPLALMALEWTTMNTLVRGRCLEEMLTTGLAPSLVSDTLALNGLRTLAPLLLTTCLLLVPFRGLEALGWVPVGCVFLVGCNYPIQALILRPRGAGWPCLISALCGLAGLALAFPWNLLGGLSLLAFTCRRFVIRELLLLQQGHPRQVSAQPNRRLRQWLGLHLPDLALLQREVRRGALLSPAWMSGSLLAALAYWYLRGDLADAGWWPLAVALLALWQAAALVQREQASATREVLLHSGLEPLDWWQSSAWISAIRLVPAAVFLMLASGWKQPILALGILTLCLVANWAGAVLGVVSAWEGSLRSTLGRAFAHLVAVGGYTTAAGLMLSTVAGDSASARRLVGNDDFLMSIFYPLSQVVPLLLVGLALWARARQVATRGWVERPSLPVLQLVPALPIAYFSQLLMRSSPEAAGWWTGVTLMFSTLWFLWAQPLLAAPRRYPARWALLCASYLLSVPLASYALAWLLVFHVSPQLIEVVAWGSQIDPLHLLLHVSIWSLVVARLNWTLETELPPASPTRWQMPALVATLLGALGLSWAQYLGRPVPEAEVAAFRSRQRAELPRRGPYRELLANYARNHLKLEISRQNPRWVQGLRDHDLLQPELREPLRQLIESGAPLDHSVPSLLSALSRCEGDVEATLENLEWIARLLESCRDLEYPYVGHLYQRLTKIVTSGLNPAQLNRLEATFIRLESLLSDQLPDSAAHYEQERLRTMGSEAGRGPDSRLYFKKQADLTIACYLQKRPPSPGHEPYQRIAYLYLGGQLGHSGERTMMRQALQLERLRLQTGAYPKRFRPDAGLRYRQTSDGRYELIGFGRRLDADGLHYGYRYR